MAIKIHQIYGYSTQENWLVKSKRCEPNHIEEERSKTNQTRDSFPPKAILGTAYEFATGRRLASGDFEGGKSGAVKVLGELGFTVQEKRRPGK